MTTVKNRTPTLLVAFNDAHPLANQTYSLPANNLHFSAGSEERTCAARTASGWRWHSDIGLAPLQTQLRRATQAPESWVDP
jgi:hypothetical protein